jgi:D-glycero-D-manno-heptose 1,7-bisphosphate phosphatase
VSALLPAELREVTPVRCVFIDRDGTLIRHVPYLCDVERVELLPTVVEGLSELRAAGCKLFLHSNQSGIGRGYFSLAQAEACNVRMLQCLGLGADLFEEVRLCPEAPEQQIAYRKPSSRYALEVMARYAADRRYMCYIGDNVTDLLTARNVGCAAVAVDTGVAELRRSALEHGLDYPVFETFLDAARYVVSHFEPKHAAR